MANQSLGFIGLGVMGEPMCGNLARKSGRAVLAFDVESEPLARLAQAGVTARPAAAAIMREAEVVFMALPNGNAVRAVCEGRDGLLAAAQAGKTVIDLGTSPVGLTRELAAAFAAKGVDYADAPVARTREAAQRGELSIMVGATEALCARIRPLLACMGSDITHCGPVGCGQIAKILNNMVLFQNVLALAEAFAIGRRAGIDVNVLAEALSKGSADSFALRNHGRKAMLPREFPERAFATDYAIKDLTYALELAAQQGLAPRGADAALAILRETAARGYARNYFPALLEVVDPLD
ncbi:MAG: NAD(P)-dependent oxidoreductase [Gammaproteobacteria bacterium]